MADIADMRLLMRVGEQVRLEVMLARELGWTIVTAEAFGTVDTGAGRRRIRGRR